MAHDPAAPIRVRVLRGSCADDETCPKITDAGHPTDLHMVVVPETDPAVLDAHRKHLGPGEILVRFPRRYLPEVTP